jgi:hypothetical protein
LYDDIWKDKATSLGNLIYSRVGARLLSKMAMASHGRQVFHFFRVVCVGKGFEDEVLENDDVSFLVRRVF